MAFYETFGLATILIWFTSVCAGRWLPPTVLAASNRMRLGLLVFASLSITAVLHVLMGVTFFSVTMAVLAPFGAVLPLLALRAVWGKLGGTAQPFTSLELLGCLTLLLLLYCSALGVFTFDLYRFGYAALSGTAIAMVCAVLAIWRGHWPVAVAISAGQVLWGLGIGSSNVIDHLSHMMLVPVICVVLTKRCLVRGLQFLRRQGLGNSQKV